MQVFKYICAALGFLTMVSCADQEYALVIGTTETETVVEYVEVEPDTEIWIDSFTQVGAFDEIDILWVIDKSCSMYQHDASLLDGVEAMMNNLPTDVNWRLKMITAGGNPYITQPNTFPLTRGDDIADALAMLDALPADGWERGFDAVVEYITNDSYAQTWMRLDASLLVVFVSDEEEQSTMTLNAFNTWYQGIRNGVYMASIVWEVRPELPLIIVIILAGIASSCLALLVGLTTLRIKGIYFAIFTFGLSELLRHFFMWWEVNKTGTVGRWIPIVDNNIVYRYMVVLAAISILGAYVLRRSRYGLAMTSIGDGQDVARHMGVNTNAVQIIVFAGTCFLTGAAGALIATRWSYIDADVAFDPIRTVMTIMMSLFGGMSVLYGPILGTVILGIVSDVLLVQFPYLSRLFLGLILVFTVLFIPKGIAGLIAGKSPAGIRGPLSNLRNMFSGTTKNE